MKIYFNHSLLEDSSYALIDGYLAELVELRNISRENICTILFYQGIWEVKVCDTNLRSYLYRINDRDPVKAVIESVENGPHFDCPECAASVEILPAVVSEFFGKKLLQTCFLDRQDKILSLFEEKILSHMEYNISETGTSSCLLVNNVKGKASFADFLVQGHEFKSIEDVFTRTQEKSSKIIILGSARKSARKHDFRDHLDEVYMGIMSLDAVELSLLLQGKNDELRKAAFYQSCKLEISGESSETLDDRFCRGQREFLIPEQGKQLFEWHIKIDGKRTRIHYYIDKENKKIYIGHCGKHLATAGEGS